MTRPHSRGYIREEDYWNIGTEAERGRDGMNAREAAKRYNDHRHPAFVTNEGIDVLNWRDATQDISAVVVGGVAVPGGYEQTVATEQARLAGDMVFYSGAPFITNGTDVRGISGFGGEFDADGGFTSDRLVLTLAQHTTPIRVPAEGAVEQFLGISGFSALIRPEDVRVASAAQTNLELSSLASIEFADPPDASLTNNPTFAPYANVTLWKTAIQQNGLTAPTKSQVGRFQVEAYSGVPGAALLGNAMQASAAHRYEAEVFVGGAGLYELEYRFSDLEEAGITLPTQEQSAAYNALLDNMTLVLHGLTLRLQLVWAA